MGNENPKKAKDSLKNLFRPIPYNEINGIDDENRFVIIYTPRMSEVPSAVNNYREDSIRIWNPAINDFAPDANKIFSLEKSNDTDEEITRYGYYVPSFGVAFSRQNNHIFKNVNLNMTTPLVTSASINTLTNIAMKAANNEHRVAFMGQDLYPVFSNYSYICEVEMMGDAQIQPLMYFQLMNIPMWSGVYMIFNVTHSITPGNMVTKFKGMKLSRNPLPYNSSWFMFKAKGSYGDGEIGIYGGSGYSDIGIENNRLQNKYKRAVSPSDHYSVEINQNFNSGSLKQYGNVTVDPQIVALYNSLYEEIAALPENQPTMKWNVCISHVIRHGSGKSDHYRGHAIDLRVMHFNGGKKPEYVPTGGKQPELYTAFDIIYCLHRDVIRQCAIEYSNKTLVERGDSVMSSPDRRYNLGVLHVSTKYEGDNMCQFVVWGYKGGDEYGSIQIGHDNKWFIDNVPNEFKITASRHYNKYGYADLKRKFPNFISFTSDEIARLFDKYLDPNAVSKSLNGASLKNISYVKQRLQDEYKITDIQFCGIAGNFVAESSFDPTSEEKPYVGLPDKGGKGIAQWTGSRRTRAENWLDMPLIKAPLSRQVDYLIYELNNYETKTIPELKQQSTVIDAVKSFLRSFERAGIEHLQTRINYGNKVKEYIENGQI